MPRTLTQPEREEFLAEARPATVSVEADDGRPPLTVPVWYAYEPGGNLSFFTGTGGRRARKIELIDRSGAVSMCVQHPEWPYKYVTVEGTVVSADRPPSADQMLAVARRYLPEDAAHGFVAGELGRADSKLVLYTVRPDRWISFDFSEDAAA
jgi:nitroimidazol reductase NimA-like FMN-containing flavoprotein (pyridoxamine 5'-phosphate oxidase superfamily)